MSAHQLQALRLLSEELGAVTVRCMEPMLEEKDRTALEELGIAVVKGDLGVRPPPSHERDADSDALPGRAAPPSSGLPIDDKLVQEQWRALLHPISPSATAVGRAGPGLVLFMPHCPVQLYERVLSLLGPGLLPRTVLIGNSLRFYHDLGGGEGCAEALRLCGMAAHEDLLALSRVDHEMFDNAFTSLSVHTFSFTSPGAGAAPCAASSARESSR